MQGLAEGGVNRAAAEASGGAEGGVTDGDGGVGEEAREGALDVGAVDGRAEAFDGDDTGHFRGAVAAGVEEEMRGARVVKEPEGVEDGPAAGAFRRAAGEMDERPDGAPGARAAEVHGGLPEIGLGRRVGDAAEQFVNAGHRARSGSCR